MGLGRALGLSRRLELGDIAVEKVSHLAGCAGRQVTNMRIGIRPQALDGDGDDLPELFTQLLRLGTVIRQKAVEQADIGGQLFDRVVLRVIGGF